MKKINVSGAAALLAALLVSVPAPTRAVVPEPGNIYYGVVRDLSGEPLAPSTSSEVIMVRSVGTNQFTIAQSAILPTDGVSPNYILRPSLDDGVGARYSDYAVRSNEVIQIFVVIAGYRYPLLSSNGCAFVSDPIPPAGGRGATRSANIVLDDDLNNNCISDWWEFYYFGGYVSGTDDDDGDGYSNWAEFLAGTDPLDPLSHPSVGEPVMLSIIAATRTNLTLEWPRVQGVTYTLEWSTNAAGPFVPIPPANLFGVDSNVVDLLGANARFIRLRQQ